MLLLSDPGFAPRWRDRSDFLRVSGDRFGVFARPGLPVTLASLAAIVIFVPLFWPP